MSIGNDIVDLQTINKERTHLPRFYSKILSESEQHLYKNYEGSMPFEVFVWLLWSVKESVYKCLKRRQPDLVFTPVKIVTEQLTIPRLKDQSGLPTIQIEQKGFDYDKLCIATIVYNQQNFYSRSVINNNFIHTVVSTKPGEQEIYWGIKKINDASVEVQSAAVREFVLNRLKFIFPDKTLMVQKSEVGYPFIEAGGEVLPLLLSFSHHGAYVGYAFEME